MGVRMCLSSCARTCVYQCVCVLCMYACACPFVRVRAYARVCGMRRHVFVCACVVACVRVSMCEFACVCVCCARNRWTALV